MKHKVAAEIGGEEEREAFIKLEQSYRATKGDHYLILWREGVSKDPQANRILPFMWHTLSLIFLSSILSNYFNLILQVPSAEPVSIQSRH